VFISKPPKNYISDCRLQKLSFIISVMTAPVRPASTPVFPVINVESLAQDCPKKKLAIGN
jgi:hypothetical protein